MRGLLLVAGCLAIAAAVIVLFIYRDGVFGPDVDSPAGRRDLAKRLGAVTEGDRDEGLVFDMPDCDVEHLNKIVLVDAIDTGVDKDLTAARVRWVRCAKGRARVSAPW